jgi:flagellin-like protein
MNLHTPFADDRAVSPVIGVILMVAITVILAAVIGSFVLGLTDNVTDTPPNAQITFEFDTGATEVTLIHEGGSNIDPSTVELTGPSGSDDLSGWGGGDGVTAGESITVDYSSLTSGSPSGETLRVVWTGNSGTSNVIARATVP